MRRSNQRGSILGFIIIGVVLAAAVVGGVYALNRYQQVSTTGSQTPAAAPATSDATEKSTNNDQSAAPATQEKQSDQTEKRGTDASTQHEASQEATPQQTPAPTPSSATSSMPQTASIPLPETGPLDVLLPILGAGALMVAAIAYLWTRDPRSVASL